MCGSVRVVEMVDAIIGIVKTKPLTQALAVAIPVVRRVHDDPRADSTGSGIEGSRD